MLKNTLVTAQEAGRAPYRHSHCQVPDSVHNPMQKAPDSWCPDFETRV